MFINKHPLIKRLQQMVYPSIQPKPHQEMNEKHRSIIAIRGEQLTCLNHCKVLLAKQAAVWVTQIQQDNAPTITYEKISTQLGQENSIIVFDATKEFNANALGIISGTIIGGGMLVILLPPPENEYPNTLFLERLLKILEQWNISIYPADTVKTLPDPSFRTIIPHSTTASSLDSKNNTPSAEQQQVIEAVIRVAKGHRKRPLVLTADRGRGKSTALGFATQALIDLGLTRIIICAPAKAMIKPLLQQIDKQRDVIYFAPDELDRQRPEAELIIIDEAGAIPVPLLSRLLEHYSRIVFSTTLQGYEGNGKGFAIRFQKYLEAITPNWRSLELQVPIRWGKGDPVEALVNEVLLLNAEPAATKALEQTLFENTEYQQISAQQLVENESQLKQLFGLLIIAHYQTRPSDLLQLLDNPDINIHTLTHKGNIIAAAIVSHEGGFTETLSQQIYEGKRRPRGNLVPQILALQLGIPRAATLKTDRIMRIAVHPNCQRVQLGSCLLKLIHQHSKADYLSSSFGMCSDLLQFWRHAGYHIAHLGLKREASSGYHSAVMLCPLTPAGEILLKESQMIFKHHFCAQLADALKHYEPEMALELLSSGLGLHDTHFELSNQELRDIERFAKGFCGYDLAMSALLHFLPNALAGYHNRINRSDAALLVMRVLQHHDWTYCCNRLNLQGKQHALKSMQESVAKLRNSVTKPTTQ